MAVENLNYKQAGAGDHFVYKENLTGKTRPAQYKRNEVLVIFKQGAGIESVSGLMKYNNLIVKKRFDTLNCVLVKSRDMKAADMIKLFKKDPRVKSVSLNYAKHLKGCGGTVPDDPYIIDQWAHHNVGWIAPITPVLDADMDSVDAWDIQTGSSDVVVAVIDTGVDYTHPDLNDNMWVNPGEIAGNGIDDDGNGYVDDIYGIDTGNDDSDPMDYHGHGSHVAGIVAAEGNNEQGVAGVNWNACIMALKGFDEEEDVMYTDAEVEAINYIIAMKDAGINVVAVNASYGYTGPEDAVEKAAIEALGDAGILFVAAAGNDSTDNDTGYPGNTHYPSSYNLDNIISVAASMVNDELALFSNYGAATVDLAAPGGRILSTYLGTDSWYNPGEGNDAFYDDMESGTGNWTTTGTWDITEEQALSPTHAWSDSPGADYVESTEYELISNDIDLGGVEDEVTLGFAAKFKLESYWDKLKIYYYAPATDPIEWALTDEKACSGEFAWSDSPDGDYPDYSDNWLISQVIDLSSAGHDTQLVFMLTGITESGYDYLKIYFSADSGATWSEAQMEIDGNYPDWTEFTIPVPADYRVAGFKAAFVLDSDLSIQKDGCYIDDVEVKDGETEYFADDMESGAGDWATEGTPGSGEEEGWKYIGYITGDSEGKWYLYNASIDKKYNWEHFRVKFVLDADYSINYDGVYLDNIGIGFGEEEPAYAYMCGTSMAAPQVAGAAALVAAEYPADGSAALKTRILDGVDPIGSMAGRLVTGGRLNLRTAITTAPIPGDLDCDDDVDKNDYLIFRGAYRGEFGEAGYLPAADLNHDGFTNMIDYRIFRTLR
jgi:subtilisin family serine protease